jgi:hypothetical protein
VLEQSTNQGGTRYVLLDAYKAVADVTVAVRLAWPQLAAHSRGYDRKMRKVFEDLLSSVRGELGPYKRRDGDVLRRPTREQPGTSFTSVRGHHLHFSER